MRAVVRLTERRDSLGMRVFERIDRLVLVADDTQRRAFGKEVYERLFRAIEILILVDHNVFES